MLISSISGDSIWLPRPVFRASLERIGVVSGILLYAWSVALLVLRFRKSWKRPGFVPLSAATIVNINSTVIPLLLLVILVLRNETGWNSVRRLSWSERLWPFFREMPSQIGLVVISTALTLLLMGRMDVGPGWYERVSAMMAALWILLFIYVNIIFLQIMINLNGVQ